MKVGRVERHIISKNHKMYKVVDDYCFKSKNLYNYANYLIRQEYILNKKYMDYNKMWKLIKNDEPFKEIGSNSGQHTLKMLHLCWKSHLVMSKEWLKYPSKFLGRPKMPNYLSKNGRYTWVLTNVQSKIIDGYLNFSFKPLHPFNSLIKTKVRDKHMQTRFVPKGDHYIMEIVFEKVIKEPNANNSRIIGIDLGLNNFATVQNNIGQKSFTINGRGIKSMNNFYNKTISKYRSIAKKTNDLNWTKRLQRITTKRNNKTEHFYHAASKYIVNYCIAFQIDTVVIGYNKKWKQSLNLGRGTQHFTEISFYNFVSKLEYKLQDIGVKLIKTEESYTSKASFLNGDKMIKSIFSGERIQRGLYKTIDGVLINADVNGASNIIRKVFPDAFANGVKDVDLHPVIVNVI